MLPQASAIGNIHIGTMAGKLNGVMPAQTPIGWRIDQLSTLVPTFSLNSPFSICGMPQANSTTSRPRMTEPLASVRILPCSERDQLRQLVEIGLGELLELEEDARALSAAGWPTSRARAALAAATAFTKLGRAGERHLRRFLAGRRVEDVAEAAALALDRLAVDEMMQGLDHDCSLDVAGLPGFFWRAGCR